MNVTMKLLRLEQVYDFASLRTQNTLVMSFGGAEIAVPCSEEQVSAIVVAARGGVTTSRDAEPPAPPPPPPVQHNEAVEPVRVPNTYSPSIFVGADDQPVEDFVLDDDGVPESPIETPGVAIPHGRSAEVRPAAPPPSPQQQRMASIEAKTSQYVSKRRTAKIQELRARAEALPRPEKPAADEAGNPVVTTRLAAAQNVAVRQVEPTSSDDDGFAQG